MSGCGQVALSSAGAGRGAGGPARSALLLPLSGPSAELGQNLQAAATLGGGPGIGIDIVDCGATPESAVRAAMQAVDAGAQMLVGPVFSAQARAVGSAVRVPVITLSNNEALAGGNLFVLGVTPAQSAQAIFSIAAQRNLRDLAIVVPPGEFGVQSAAAADRTARALGLSVRPVIAQGAPDGMMAALSGNGPLPDAVYLPVADATLAPLVEALRGSGVQVLGSADWSALDLAGRVAFRGAWFAAPDPLRFAAYDDAFRTATGAPGGIIGGLAFDGVELLRILGQTGQMTVKGLTREQGFSGVVGPYRFARSGLCERGLGVLRVDGDDFSLIGSTSV